MSIGGGWESVRSSVRDEVGRSAYDAWFRNLEGRSRGDHLVVLCPDRFSREWIERRYGDAVARAARSYKSVHYEIAGADGSGGAEAHARPNRSESRNLPVSAPPGPAPRRSRPPAPRASGEASFDTFVRGEGNVLALEAARAVAGGHPGRCTPLLLTGSSGVGKTHLCRAIARMSEGTVVARSSEEFTSEVTSAMRSGGMDAIRQRYRRSANLLILEDVQFLAGKRATQVELFHTLEHLIQHGRSVVFTADCAPQALELDPRLVSRMSSGLIARIGPPDREMRREILRTRAAHGGVRIPDECLETLAARTVTSTRDLVSGLNQVVARASLLGRPITKDLVQEALGEVDRIDKPTTIEEIQRITAQAYSLSPEDLQGRSRRHRVVRPRHFAMYLCRRYTDCSLKEIGRAFRRDHTSVIHAIRAVEHRTASEPQQRYEFEALAARFGSPRERP